MNTFQIIDKGNNKIDIKILFGDVNEEIYLRNQEFSDPIEKKEKDTIRWYLDEYILFPYGAEVDKAKSIENNINFIYPYRELEQQKKYGLLYWKNDTHWNDYGSFIGTEILIKKIKNDFPELELLEESKYQKDLKQLVIDGDLSRLLGGVKLKKWTNIS